MCIFPYSPFTAQTIPSSNSLRKVEKCSAVLGRGPFKASRPDDDPAAVGLKVPQSHGRALSSQAPSPGPGEGRWAQPGSGSLSTAVGWAQALRAKAKGSEGVRGELRRDTYCRTASA